MTADKWPTPDDWSLVDNRNTFMTDRGFTLHEHYDQMQIINMVARLYDPLTGQFISVDPMADKYPGWGAYVYCLNNPVEFFDPKGEATYDHTGKKINSDGGVKENYFQDKDGVSHSLPSANTLNTALEVLDVTNNGKPMTEYGTYTMQGEDGHLPIAQGDGLQILSNDEQGISCISTVTLPAISDKQRENVEASIHSHPVGQMDVKDYNGNNVPLSFTTTDNSDHDKTTFSKHKTNIVVGNLDEGGQGATFFGSDTKALFSVETSSLEKIETQIEFEENFENDLQKLKNELENTF